MILGRHRDLAIALSANAITPVSDAVSSVGSTVLAYRIGPSFDIVNAGSRDKGAHTC